eukprot:2368072-Rhodomonas_salina.4
MADYSKESRKDQLVELEAKVEAMKKKLVEEEIEQGLSRGLGCRVLSCEAACGARHEETPSGGPCCSSSTPYRVSSSTPYRVGSIIQYEKVAAYRIDQVAAQSTDSVAAQSTASAAQHSTKTGATGMCTRSAMRGTERARGGRSFVTDREVSAGGVRARKQASALLLVHRAAQSAFKDKRALNTQRVLFLCLGSCCVCLGVKCAALGAEVALGAAAGGGGLREAHRANTSHARAGEGVVRGVGEKARGGRERSENEYCGERQG